MLNRLRLLIAAALAALVICLPIAALGGFANFGATALGFGDPPAAVNISAGFVSNSIDMDPAGSGGGQAFTKLSIPLTVVWGTSATFELRLQGSNDGTTWRYVTRCTSAEVHVCKPRRWSLAAADWGALQPVLTFTETDYRWLRFELVAGAGTGTILASATRAP
jgi:hypothetical protein